MKRILSIVIVIFTPFFSLFALDSELYINYENFKTEVVDPLSVTSDPNVYFNTISFDNRKDSILASTINGEIILNAKVSKLSWLKNIEIVSSTSDTIARITMSMIQNVKYSYAYFYCEQVESEIKIKIKYPLLSPKPTKIKNYLSWLPYDYKVVRKDYIYPQKAVELGYEGTALLKVFINEKGDLDSSQKLCYDSDQILKLANDVINNIKFNPLVIKDSTTSSYSFLYLFSTQISKSNSTYFGIYQKEKLSSYYHTLGVSKSFLPNAPNEINYNFGFNNSVEFNTYKLKYFFNNHTNREFSVTSYLNIGIYYDWGEWSSKVSNDKSNFIFSSLGLKYSFGYGYKLSENIDLGLLYSEKVPFLRSGLYRLKNIENDSIVYEKGFSDNIISETGLLFNYNDYFLVDLSYSYNIFYNRNLVWTEILELLSSGLTTYLLYDFAEKDGKLWVPAADYIIKTSLSFFIYSQQKKNPKFPFGKGGESYWIGNYRIGFHFPFSIGI